MEEAPRKGYWGYRLLGIIDTFIAILFLFAVLVNFAVMGFSPSLLLPIFISLSVLLYVNLATVFTRYVMIKGHFLRHRLKDWIKVNAYVTLIYAALVILVTAWMLTDTSLMEKISHKMSLPEPLLVNTSALLIVCMTLLFLHVLLTFRYLRQFAGHFRDEEIS